MNELQIALLGAGALAVVGVWIYNALQERKHRKLADAVFKGGQDDVLLRSARNASANPGTAATEAVEAVVRREPGTSDSSDDLDIAPVPAEEPSDLDADSRQPADTGVEATPAAAPAAAGRGSDDLLPWADPLADCIVSFISQAPVALAGIQAAQGTLHSDLSKPVNWLARQDERSPWLAIDTSSPERYNHWLVALQLVDRRGAISDAELGRFMDGLRQLGHHLDISIELPGRSEMLMRAQELDRFCASVDVQFALSVINAQGGVFAGTKLRGVCEAAGLTLEADGLYHARNAAGESEFALGNQGNEPFDPAGMTSLATHGVSLFIDVPRVSDGTGAFNRMVLVARQLAQGLGGTLVDANRTPLAEPVIATIRGKIGELQQVLHSAGISPGGARAMRLFA